MLDNVKRPAVHCYASLDTTWKGLGDVPMTEGKYVRRECFFCGETFYAQNPTAKFDTAACRLKAFRWRKRVNAHQKRVLQTLDSLTEYLSYPDSREQAASVISNLSHQFTETMRAFNIRRVK